MVTMIASYREPSQITEEIQINEKSTEYTYLQIILLINIRLMQACTHHKSTHCQPNKVLLYAIMFTSDKGHQSTGDWDCNKLLLVRSYQPHHKQIHKLHKEGETQLLTHLQRLFPSVHCAYINLRTRVGANTFIYKRDWNIFTLTSLLTPFLDKPKLYY